MEAARRYQEFHGEPAKIVKRRLDKLPKAAYKLGNLVGVAYETRRDGENQRYFHEFKKAARPELLVESGGQSIHINGGRYVVTDRGIIDK